MPSLLDVTDVPMKNILEKCSFKSVLALRKVCHSLRNFIDKSCFTTDLDNIHIKIDPSGLFAICNNSKVFGAEGTATVKNSSELKFILKMAQTSKSLNLYLETHPDSIGAFDELEEILKNQTRPLPAECLSMEGSEVLKILPYLDSMTLKEISISPSNYETENQSLDGTEQFLESEQFKNAVKIEIDDSFLLRADLRKFFHFQEVTVRFHETSLEELVALKEAFFTSTHMKRFNLNSCNQNVNQLEKVFGTAFNDPRYTPGASEWFFAIRNCKEYVLRIELTLGFEGLDPALQFWKLEAKKVPEDAVVQY